MKKKFVKICMAITVIIALIHIVHMLTLDRIVQYRELTFYSANWPQELDGYRIAFAADTHRLSEAGLQEIVAELNARNINLLLLGGDYSLRRNKEDMLRTFAAFSQVQTTDGIFGVEGNHDRRFPLDEIMPEFGIVYLENEGQHIRDGFFLGGVSDFNPWPCVASSIDGAQEGDFVLLLMHNSDISMEQSTAGIDLILAGHTHGGQIAFFGWAFYLYGGNITSYNLRFAYGWAESLDGVPVYVTRGLGQYTVPRVFARPQVVILTMHSI